MPRIVWTSLVLAALTTGGVFSYTTWAREREYRRLITTGDAALKGDQPSLAIEAFSGAIALKGDSMLAYLKRGETYRRRGDLTAALRDLRTAIQLDPAATRPLEQLGDVNYALQRYARAAERYAAYLRLDDRDPRVLYKLALASYREGNAAAAVPHLHRAIALNDRFAEAHYLLGLCRRDQRAMREAVESLRQAVRLAPGLTAAREELAELYFAAQRDREGIEQLEALAALEPERPERYVMVSLAYARTGRTDMAVLALGRAAERFPDNAGIYSALGRVWLLPAESRSDRAALRKALEALERRAAMPAPSSSDLAAYGRALLLAGDAGRAEAALQRAVATLPVALEAFTYLAQAAQRLGHLAIERDALIQFLALAEDPVALTGATVRVGDLSLRLDDPPAAVFWFQQATGRSKPETPVLVRLAEAQLRAGSLDDARATVSRGLERDPRSPALRALQRRLR